QVCILDASGLNNSYAIMNRPLYTKNPLAPGIIKMIEKLNDKISDSEYENICNRILTELNYPLSLSYLTESDVEFLFKELRRKNINIDTIHEYFEKYKNKYSLDID